MYALHEKFKALQAGLPPEIVPSPIRIYGGGTEDRVPKFIGLVKRNSFANYFDLHVEGGKYEVACVHTTSKDDPENIYAEMRGYAIDGKILFVFSKNPFIKGSSEHKTAEAYLRQLIKKGDV